jgi:hypothetical protein
VENVLRISRSSGLANGIAVAVLTLLYVFYRRYATPLRKNPQTFPCKHNETLGGPENSWPREAQRRYRVTQEVRSCRSSSSKRSAGL